MTMSWRQLLSPEYVLAFVESHLLAFIPGAGLGHLVTGNGASVGELVHVPSFAVLAGGALLGLVNGIRAIRNLRAPTPTEAPKP